MPAPKAPPGFAGTLCSFIFAPLLWNLLDVFAFWLRQVFDLANKAHEIYPDRISSPFIYFLGNLFDSILLSQLVTLIRLNSIATLKWMWSAAALRLPQAWLVSILPTLIAGTILYLFARIVFAKLPRWRQSRGWWIVTIAFLGGLSALLTWGGVAVAIPHSVLASPTAFYGHFLDQLPPFWPFFFVTATTGALLGAAIGWLSGGGEIRPQPQTAATSTP